MSSGTFFPSVSPRSQCKALLSWVLTRVSLLEGGVEFGSSGSQRFPYALFPTRTTRCDQKLHTGRTVPNCIIGKCCCDTVLPGCPRWRSRVCDCWRSDIIFSLQRHHELLEVLPLPCSWHLGPVPGGHPPGSAIQVRQLCQEHTPLPLHQGSKNCGL